MVNTRILLDKFEYLEPRTIDEAVQYLEAYGDKAKLIAGGTDLLVQMKMEKVHPRYLIHISRIPSLRYLIEEKGLRIGSLTLFREIEKSQLIKRKYTAFFEAARSVSSVQIKTMGTIGGNLCNGSPAADAVPPLLVFESRVRTMNGKEEKTLPLDHFFVGPGQTILGSNQLLTEIEVPEVSGQVGSAFLKMGRVHADLSKVSVAVAITRRGDVCEDCKIALGAVAKIPLRVKKSEAILKGKRVTDLLIARASQEVTREIEPITDVRSTASYRKEVARVMTRDAINLAWERAKGKP
ncbi:MAG: xanthine dehydrogenase family protein subunit M [Thermodesulfobacteriota bacterium]